MTWKFAYGSETYGDRLITKVLRRTRPSRLQGVFWPRLLHDRSRQVTAPKTERGVKA